MSSPSNRAATAGGSTTSARARADERPEYHFVGELAENFPQDVGIVASLFLHFVRVGPGESVYIGAGMVHSYIRGLGLELMATSNNATRRCTRRRCTTSPCGRTSRAFRVTSAPR